MSNKHHVYTNHYLLYHVHNWNNLNFFFGIPKINPISLYSGTSFFLFFLPKVAGPLVSEIRQASSYADAAGYKTAQQHGSFLVWCMGAKMMQSSILQAILLFCWRKVNSTQEHNWEGLVLDPGKTSSFWSSETHAKKEKALETCGSRL